MEKVYSGIYSGKGYLVDKDNHYIEIYSDFFKIS